MSPKKDDQNMQASGVRSIKADIQSLAHQLWLRKRHTTDGVDWLVDGWLRDQLDELSWSELVRIKRLLLRRGVQNPSHTRRLVA